MRIRSIRPEFWASDDVAALDWHQRLVFIGLWSYVDDNGVGRDSERLITSSLFPLDDDLTESSLRVHGALKRLCEGGQITRYEAEGRRWLHVTAWDTHQRINRASESRYPTPDQAEHPDHASLTEPSLSPHGGLTPGEGEKGRRGEGEKKTPSESSAPRKRDDTTPTTRATRLPDPYPLTDDMQAWGLEHAPHARPRDHDQFCDYWHAKPGRAGTKLDWRKTWQTWMRRASDERPQPRGRPPHTQTPTERATEVAQIGARLQAAHDAREATG